MSIVENISGRFILNVVINSPADIRERIQTAAVKIWACYPNRHLLK
jgi:hypothetical protein